MLTKLGIFLRKLRLDNGEILKNMADKLGVSSSFLSAVENGKKRIPKKWFDQIPKIYQMNREEEDEFRIAIAQSEDAVEINLQNLSFTKREFAFSLARKIDSIAEEDIARMLKKMKEYED